MLIRKPTLPEKKLLELLVSKSIVSVPANWREDLMVSPLDDGDMGSLRLFPKGNPLEERKFGQQISDFQFKDLDGVEVIASLNLDSNGDLYELDIWKTNFDKLIMLPNLL